MRSIYYQSVGNPVQTDRLPRSRPTLQMLAPSLTLEEKINSLLGFAMLSATMVIGVYAFLPKQGLAWLEPFDLIFALPTIAISVLLWAFTARFKWLNHGPFLLAIGLLALSRNASWGTEVLLLSIVLGILTYAFGCHWLAVCTTSPITWGVAQSLRNQWQPQMVVVSTFIGVMVAGLFWTGNRLLFAALVTLPLTVLLVPAPDNLKLPRWRVITESLASWLMYDAKPLPGLFQGVVGQANQRRALTLLVFILVAILLARWNQSPLNQVVAFAQTQTEQVDEQLASQGAGIFERLRYGLLAAGITLVTSVVLPVVISMTLVVAANFPLLIEAAAKRDQASSNNAVTPVFEELRLSPDLTERESIYLGRVVADGSPAIVSKKVLREHAHGLGDSGSGKTSLFLCPIIEQLVRSGDCSVIVLDLKGDSLELLASLESAAKFAREKHRLRMPLKHFSNQADRASFAFNPLSQVFWGEVDLITRTDILCAACGLSYGADYGQGYYSSANAAILHCAIKTFPNVANFVELADCIGEVMVTAKKSELHPEIRKAGVHVHEVIKRLAACAPLNVTQSTPHHPGVFRDSINMVELFQEPQLMYFHLPATLSPSAAAEIGRLANYMLLAASTQTERRVPVYLVIDEFQRMVASNLEYMLQLARSMGVGVILANQSLQDLKKGTTNLIPTVEANCRLRQWFGVSCSEDQERLIQNGGVTVDYLSSISETTGRDGFVSQSYSQQEQIVSRVTINDILLTTDHPLRSFLRISRGEGYAQYGGMPVAIESTYHISQQEYQRRRKLIWPAGEGTFVPKETGHGPTAEGSPAQNTQASPTKEQWTTEVIGEAPKLPPTSADQKSIEDLFQQLKKDLPKNIDPPMEQP